MEPTVPHFQACWWLRHVMGMLISSNDEGFIIILHRQNPKGKPGSVCFPTDTERQIHLSAGQ